MKNMSRRTKRLLALLLIEVIVAINVFGAYAADDEAVDAQIEERMIEEAVGESGDSGMLYLTPDNKSQVNYWNGSALQNSGYTQALNIFIEGQPMGLFYGYVFDGIVQEGEEVHEGHKVKIVPVCRFLLSGN